MPWEFVAGAPVADPANEPWPAGTPTQLSSLGHPLTRIEESGKTRMPTPEEVETLGLASGVPVFSITRRMVSVGQVLEVAQTRHSGGPGCSQVRDRCVRVRAPGAGVLPLGTPIGSCWHRPCSFTSQLRGKEARSMEELTGRWNRQGDRMPMLEPGPVGPVSMPALPPAILQRLHEVAAAGASEQEAIQELAELFELEGEYETPRRTRRNRPRMDDRTKEVVALLTAVLAQEPLPPRIPPAPMRPPGIHGKPPPGWQDPRLPLSLPILQVDEPAPQSQTSGGGKPVKRRGGGARLQAAVRPRTPQPVPGMSKPQVRQYHQRQYQRGIQPGRPSRKRELEAELGWELPARGDQLDCSGRWFRDGNTIVVLGA
jgi:hypothetical protein